MHTSSLISLLSKMHAAEIRYLVAGGYAVIAHGYMRMTMDLDLIVDFRGGQAARLASILEAEGYRPRAPVAMASLGDDAARASWVADKNAQVFTALRPNQFGQDEVDIFLTEPFDFDQAYADGLQREMPGGLTVRFVDFDRLIAMKRNAGRPKDVQDIEMLTLKRQQGSTDE